MAHGDAPEGKWRGNWRMEWVASTLTLPRNMVYPALLPLMRTPRLPAVDWTDAPADLNGLVRYGERRNLVTARVPSRFKRTQPPRSHRLLTWLQASVWKIPFLSLFCSWVEGLLVLGCSPLSTGNRVSHSKISVFNPSYISLTVLGWKLTVKFMTDVFEQPVTEASNRSTGCTKNIRLQYFVIAFLGIRVQDLELCGNKMPTSCNRGSYCRSYCLLNTFRTPLCPSSGAQK